MLSLTKTTIAAAATAAVLSACVIMPAQAGEARTAPALAQLDKMPVEYTQYRRGYHGYYRHDGWRGPSRGAVVAGAIGLGILGAAAAAAASRPAYAEPYYGDYGYAAPVYEAYPPVYVAPRPYGRYYAPAYDFRDHR